MSDRIHIVSTNRLVLFKWYRKMKHAVFPRKSNDDANAMAPSSATRAISNASMNRIRFPGLVILQSRGQEIRSPWLSKRNETSKSATHEHHTTTAYNRPFRFVYRNDQNNSLTKYQAYKKDESKQCYRGCLRNTYSTFYRKKNARIICFLMFHRNMFHNETISRLIYTREFLLDR